MLPSGIVGMCWVGLSFVSSFNVAPVTLSYKVLMHLVFPRCKVRSVKLLDRKSASHLSVHYVDFFSVDEPVLLIVTVYHNTVE